MILHPDYHGPEVWRSLAAEGLTKSEAAARLGLTRQAAQTAAERHDIRFATVAERRLAQIRAHIEAGRTAPETARAMGMDGPYIRAIAKRAGLRFPACPPSSPAAHLSPEKRADYHHLLRRKGFRAHEALAIVEARP